jgi:hypothetical protein
MYIGMYVCTNIFRYVVSKMNPKRVVTKPTNGHNLWSVQLAQGERSNHELQLPADVYVYACA